MGYPRTRRRKFPVRRQLTLAGWLFLVVTLLTGLSAVRSQAPLTFALFGGMLGIVAVSAVLASRMVAGVSVQRDVPDRLWQNQTAYFSYYLRSRRRWSSCLGLQVGEVSLENVDFAAGYCVHLEARSVFRAGARFAPRKRGRMPLERVRLSTSFPFGLVRASRLFGQPANIVVWPARGKLKGRMLHKGAVEVSSASPAVVQGGQDEFFGLREYRPGDNPRWIHWRRSAVRSTPVVREMARPRPEVLWVVVDTLPVEAAVAGQGARERMLRFAATLIDHAFAKGYKVGLALALGRGVVAYEPAPGVGQRRKLLDALADVDDDTAGPLEEAIGHLKRNSRRDAQVIVIAGRQDRMDQAAFLSLRAACGSLSVVWHDGLVSVFEDDPLAGKEGAPCR